MRKRAVSAARETENRRIACIETALAQAVGPARAAHLMQVAEAYDEECAQQPVELESAVAKIRRLRKSEQGRERLKRAKTFADVEHV